MTQASRFAPFPPFDALRKLHHQVSAASRPSPEHVLTVVSALSGIPLEALQSPSQLRRLGPARAAAAYLLRVDDRDVTAFQRWLLDAATGELKPFARLAAGMTDDLEAITNAFRYPWSTGPVDLLRRPRTLRPLAPDDGARDRQGGRAYKRDKTILPTFRPQGALTYDERIMSWKGLEQVSLVARGLSGVKLVTSDTIRV